MLKSMVGWGQFFLFVCLAFGFQAFGDTYHTDHRNTPKLEKNPEMPHTWATGRDLAIAYVKERLKTYGLDPATSELELTQVQQSLFGTHYRFQQKIHGARVKGGEIIVSLTKDGKRIYQAYNNSYPLIKPPSAPSQALQDQTRLWNRAWRLLNVTGPLTALPISSQPVFLPTATGFQYATRVVLSVGAPFGTWEIYLDPVTGNPLSIRNAILPRLKRKPAIHPPKRRFMGPLLDREWAFQEVEARLHQWQSQPKARRANGTALVFDPDPRTTLKNYGLDDDTDPSAFENAYVERVLRDLTFDGSLYSLVGPWVQVIDFEAPATAPSTSPDGHWTHKRGNNAFNDVMTYFHIDQSQRYLQSLGFVGEKGIQADAIVVDTDGVMGQDNSYFDTLQNRLSFGHGCVDDNEDADVILHEYGHAIHQAINPSWGGGDTGAMGEGFGDYWAGSYSLITQNGADFYFNEVYSWDGHGAYNACWAGRVLNAVDAKYNSTVTYDAHEPLPNGHQSDEIWSTPLFQSLLELLAMGVSRESVDRIVLESQFGLGSGLRMPDLAQSVLTAAKNLEPDGPHYAVFLKHFLNQKIIAKPEAKLALFEIELTAGTNQVADPGETVSLQAVLRNEGTLNATQISALLKNDTPAASIVQANSTYPDITVGATETNATAFQTKISATAACGDRVPLHVDVTFTDDAPKTSSLPFFLQLGVPQMFDVNQNPQGAIPDADANTPYDTTLNVTESGNVHDGRLFVDMNIQHTYIGDLIVTLTSPAGTQAILHNRTGGFTAGIHGSYPTTLTPDQPLTVFNGESLKGEWKLSISDKGQNDTGVLESWGLRAITHYECE